MDKKLICKQCAIIHGYDYCGIYCDRCGDKLELGVLPSPKPVILKEQPRLVFA
jgi:hypothetical protein